MATEVVMPKMGYDMEEGTVLRWLKHEGDPISKGDILAEIETGKVSIEMEAFDEGILRAVLVQEGETVPVGTPMAILGTADEAITIPERSVNGSKGEVAGTAPPPAAGAPSLPVAAGSASGSESSASANTADATTSAASTSAASTSEASTSAANASLANASLANASVAGGSAAGASVAGTSVAGASGPGASVATEVRASPLARRLANEHGLPLATVGVGSGPGGRIVRDDIEAALARGVAAVPAGALAAGAPRESHREALSGMRRTIARRLADSWQAAPHIFVTMAVEMDRAQALRAEVNDLAPEGGLKISLNDMVIKAVARALTEHPRLNVSWDEGERIVHGAINIGNAVALEDGLMTVVVADADLKPLSAISTELHDKAERARSGRLRPDDLSVRSTFTVSNMGMFGVESFTAIINPPEAAILAIGAAAEEAVVRDGAVVARLIMRLTLSADHRVVDGATAALFLRRVKELLEHPAAILV